MKCPFCMNDNTLLLVEVETDDCNRTCVECTNCGLRGPGADIGSGKFGMTDEEIVETDMLAWEFFEEMANAMSDIWNPE